MIIKFDKFTNESIRDQMIPKELSDDQKKIIDAQQDIISIGLQTSKIESNNGVYKFIINSIKNKDINVYYNSDEMKKYYIEEYLKTQPKGWYVTVQEFGKNLPGFGMKAENWNEMLIKIIDVCFPEIDKIIDNLKRHIQSLEYDIISNKKILEGIIKAKKIKEAR